VSAGVLSSPPHAEKAMRVSKAKKSVCMGEL
jgi:hypothetical protein